MPSLKQNLARLQGTVTGLKTLDVLLSLARVASEYNYARPAINDEGRYAIEDTRVAVQEARRAGLRLFGVTVDAQGRDYLPYIFGPGAYAIFPHVARLPAALPAIYRQLTG